MQWQQDDLYNYKQDTQQYNASHISSVWENYFIL